MSQAPVNYGLDVYRKYEAHLFDFTAEPLTERGDVQDTWKRFGWTPPSEKPKKVPA